MRAAARSLIASILVLILSGCAGSTPAAPSATPPDVSAPAPTEAITQPVITAEEKTLNKIWPGCSPTLKGTPVTFTGAKGEEIQGALMGDGETGIVLSNQSDNDVCAWGPFTRHLLDAKYRVLSYSYGDDAGPDEVIAASQVLLANGATRVILVGGSWGGSFTAIAASRNPPGVVAAVTLSAGILTPDEDPQPFVDKIAIPILVASADVDPSGSYPLAQGMFEKLTVADKELYIVPKGKHGIWLMDDKEPREKVMAWLEAHR